ncbi:MAG: energy transducer TonB [Hydrogenophilales bacterium 12-61-10]|nr:MAG: energy transducer TonB [Hydrogenophilales bacterium 12-61-10]OYX31971.1 MAG: energy transducer TonB [Hydrogenophilales bacterium 32-62-9]
MSPEFKEPTIPAASPAVQRMLLAGWISLGVHAALIALVQVAPPAATTPPGAPVIEARLAPRQPAPAVAAPPPAVPVVAAPEASPTESPRLLPSALPETLPVALPDMAPPKPATIAPVPPAPAAIASAPSAPAQPAASPPTGTAAPDQATPPPAAAITSAVDLTYYNAREVDVHPRALGQVVPDYPAEADRRRVSGKLLLQLKLQADGRVSDLQVLKASPPGVFDESALQAFRSARFAPAQKNGRPVRALVQIEVVYDWEGQMSR